MGNVIDLTGKQFGRWTVLECVGRNKSGGAVWLCQCECGTMRNVDGRSLRDGVSKSCGCLGAEHRLAAVRIKSRKHGGKANGTTERLYGVWIGMKDRCDNQNSRYFSMYGGRGITLCDEWEDYAAFREWALATGYDPTAPKGACTIDRIDNNKGYSPDNCRWATSQTQCNNRRNNHVIECFGEAHTISEWARKTGIRKDTLRRRIINYGWSPERALTEALHH